MRKIVIAGGDSKAEYIINFFRDRKDSHIVVINPSKEVAERLKQACKVSVRHGEPWNRRALEEADAFDADVFIALCDRDVDNFAACLMAKEVLGPSKVICVVDNPNNVEIFGQLGVPSVISSTYELGQKIMDEASFSDLSKVIANVGESFEFIEFRVMYEHAICNCLIRDIGFPPYATIAAIVRKGKAIIPSGAIKIQARDRLYIGIEPKNKESLNKYLRRKRATDQRPAQADDFAEIRAFEKGSVAAKPEPAPKKAIKTTKTTKK